MIDLTFGKVHTHTQKNLDHLGINITAIQTIPTNTTDLVEAHKP